MTRVIGAGSREKRNPGPMRRSVAADDLLAQLEGAEKAEPAEEGDEPPAPESIDTATESAVAAIVGGPWEPRRDS